MSEYDLAQVCLGGHVITSRAFEFPTQRKDFCPNCGQPTVTNCPTCRRQIKGSMIIDGFAGRTIYNIPKYCEYCGHSFPWTENALNEANELIDGFDALSDDEKDALKQDIDDMVKDTFRAPVAATRYQKLVAKVGDEAIFALKTILYGLFTHAIATQLRWI